MSKLLQARLHFQIYNVGFEKAKPPKIKLPTSVRSWGKQGNSRITSNSVSLTMLRPLTAWLTTNYRKFLNRDDSTCLLRNQYAGQEATIRTRVGTNDCFLIGEGERQGRILSCCLFNLYAEYSPRNAGLDDSQAGIKIDISQIHRWYHTAQIHRWYHSDGRKWRATRESFDKVQKRRVKKLA